MSLTKALLACENIMLDVDVSSKKRLLEEVSKFIESRHGLSAEAVFECLFNREKLGSTGLGCGVAIPHGRLTDLVGEHIAVFFRTKEAIDFDAPDDKAVSMFFVLIVPENADNKHLEVLSNLASIFSSKENRETLSTVEDIETICNIFAK